MVKCAYPYNFGIYYTFITLEIEKQITFSYTYFQHHYYFTVSVYNCLSMSSPLSAWGYSWFLCCSLWSQEEQLCFMRTFLMRCL